MLHESALISFILYKYRTATFIKLNTGCCFPLKFIVLMVTVHRIDKVMLLWRIELPIILRKLYEVRHKKRSNPK